MPTISKELAENLITKVKNQKKPKYYCIVRYKNTFSQGTDYAYCLRREHLTALKASPAVGRICYLWKSKRFEKDPRLKVAKRTCVLTKGDLTAKSEEGGISTKRLLEILASPNLVVYMARFDSNDYGEFVFIYAKAKNDAQIHPEYGHWKSITFWGCGYHAVWERTVTNRWAFHDDQFPPEKPAPISLHSIQKMIEKQTKTLPKKKRTGKREKLARELGLFHDPGAYLDFMDEVSGGL